MSPDQAPGSIFPYLNAPGRGMPPSGAMQPIFGANAVGQGQQPISGSGSIPGGQPGTQSPTDFLQKMVLTTKLIDAFGGEGKTHELASKAGGLLGGLFGSKGGGAGGGAAGSTTGVDATSGMAAIA